MININDAIAKSKTMPDVSNGGSKCYDFGDVVLVKYTLSLEYVKPGYRAREKEESIMMAINEKAANGVNTPRHIDMKRVIEDNQDVCYVLQEKCKGRNCASMSKYGEPIDVVLSQLEYVNNIPFEHYVKLVQDSCMLYEMGYEAKNKNLFYDDQTGFWFIDFLDNKEDKFDMNNPRKVFEAIKFVCPRILQITSSTSIHAKISEEDRNKYESLQNSIKAKFFLAIKKAIPTFAKYELFYLLDEYEDENFNKYLMDKNIVNRDLFNATNEDFSVYNELFSNVVNEISHDIAFKGKLYWQVEANDIRNKSELLGLISFYKRFICNDISKEDYEDEWDYTIAIKRSYTSKMMLAIYEKLCDMEPNENITKFISEFKATNNINAL